MSSLHSSAGARGRCGALLAPETYANTLSGTHSRYDLSHGNILPAASSAPAPVQCLRTFQRGLAGRAQVALPWSFNGWTPETSNSDRTWFFHSDDFIFYGKGLTHQACNSYCSCSHTFPSLCSPRRGSATMGRSVLPDALPTPQNARYCVAAWGRALIYKYKYKYKYTCDTGQTRNKLLAQWVHLTNHAAGHSRPGNMSLNGADTQTCGSTAATSPGHVRIAPRCTLRAITHQRTHARAPVTWLPYYFNATLLSYGNDNVG